VAIRFQRIKRVIKDIILTAEKLDDTPVNYEDLNTDVIVNFENGDRYVATFFSCKNLKKTVDADLGAFDFSSDRYYRILNMVLVEDLSKGNLLPVIESMIAEGDFQLIFKKI
jgi:hypothetical protein